MESKLAKTLIDKQIIKRDTEVIVEYNAIDLSGQPRSRVQGNFVVTRVADQTVFVTSTVDGRKRKVLAEDIVSIDGMDPVRLARNYNIKADGSTSIPGKRRGRKPKIPPTLAA